MYGKVLCYNWYCTHLQVMKTGRRLIRFLNDNGIELFWQHSLNVISYFPVNSQKLAVFIV